MFAMFLKLGSPWNFRNKLLVIFMVFTAVMSATFTGLYTAEEIRSYKLQAAEKSQLLAAILANAVRLPLYGEDKSTLEQLAAASARYPGVKRVVIFNAEGKVIAAAGPGPGSSVDNVASASADVTSGLKGVGVGNLSGMPDRDAKPLGKVAVVMDRAELTMRVRSMVVTSVVTAFLFWIALTLVSYLVVKWITRSLTPLTAGIRSIRGGDYSFRIASTSRDELGAAANAVNELAAELLRREAENGRLQQELINSMKLEMSEERKKMMAKLIQANRMTSLGLLVSSMAHEINTPNGAIKLAGQQVARAWKSAIPILDGVAREEGDFVLGGGVYSMVREEVLRATEIVGRSSERIERVIQDLRAFSTGERNALHEVNIGQVVSDAVAIIRAHGRYSNIAIQTRVKPELPAVIGARYQLEQVFINLLLNGMQAIPEGRMGTVDIGADFDPANGDVVITVSDDGEGISPGHLAQLVEPFFSTRMEKGGSGLGLYISNFIITEHMGRLEFASELGRGTIITIHLPAKPTQALARSLPNC
jgi:two-component system, NtrC family, sensor kinase